jgi:hypothetical protein
MPAHSGNAVYVQTNDADTNGPMTTPSAGATPYGFDFTSTGALIVTEAFGGQIGAAAAPSYALTAPGWAVEADGGLSPIGEFTGVPPTVAGLAAG